jgi:hypothetical protein
MISSQRLFHRNNTYVEINIEQEVEIINAVKCQQPVHGLTHDFYKYPARFSPILARTLIDVFTKPGEWVLDPHVGGGTTLVEAISLGRHALGVDISSLAEFVCQVKTTQYSREELARLHLWADQILEKIKINRSSVFLDDYAKLGYYKYLDGQDRWRLRKAIEQGIGSAISLGSPRLENFARCAVLRTAQWALDGRQVLPSYQQFRKRLIEVTVDMIDGAAALSQACEKSGCFPQAHVFNRSAIGIDEDDRMRNIGNYNLILTSPPYPGIHVLYHRWQVDGRKEAPTPFMIAKKLDGSGGSYYTMGDRKETGLGRYFREIEASMRSAAALALPCAVIVQVVAFADPTLQLDRYLRAMEAAGLQEIYLNSLANEGDGRLWRSVPGRRWYSRQRGETAGSQEVVLFHRKSESLNQSQIHAPRPLHPQAGRPLREASAGA